MKNVTQIVSGAIVFKLGTRGQTWFVTKRDRDSDWEFPKSIARKGESSVRASLRVMGEMGGMNVRVLEEAGRTSSVITNNGKAIPQKLIYYLMLSKTGGEVIGFPDYKWLEYKKALKLVNSKRDKIMLKQAKKVLREWEKRQKSKKKK